MYVDYEDFEDEYYFFKDYSQDPYNAYYDPNNNGYFQYLDSLYFLPSTGEWSEGFIFGGSDRFYGTSNALTEEVRLDLTSQFTNEWRARFGFDIKSHKLDFYEVENPGTMQELLRKGLLSSGMILELMEFLLQKIEKIIFSLMKAKVTEPGMVEMVSR